MASVGALASPVRALKSVGDEKVVLDAGHSGGRPCRLLGLATPRERADVATQGQFVTVITDTNSSWRMVMVLATPVTPLMYVTARTAAARW